MSISRGFHFRSLVALCALAAGAASAAPLAYVANHGSDTVSIIDLATASVVGTIEDIPQPLGIAITPDGSRAYVTNADGVRVIDTVTNGVIDNIELSFDGFNQPGITAPGPGVGIAMAPDGTRAYVTNRGLDDRVMFVIDTATNQVTQAVEVRPTWNPSLAVRMNSIAAAPDGKRVYALGSVDVLGTATETALVVFHTATADVTYDTVAVPRITGSAVNPLLWAEAIAVSPDGARVYLRGEIDTLRNTTVEVFDTAAYSFIDTIDIEPGLSGIVATPDGTRVYVASSYNSEGVSVIDTATNSLAGTIPLALGSELLPVGLTMTPDERYLLLGSFGAEGDDSVSIIDVATHTAIGDPVRVGVRPIAIAVGPAPGISALVTDPANPLTIYAGTAGAGMYRSTDGGTNWAPINNGLDSNTVDQRITALAISANGATVYAATRTTGVFRTTNGGASWQAASSGLDPRVLSLHLAAGNVLLAGVDGGGGVYRSDNGGNNWYAINEGLPDAMPVPAQ